jgi:hypothetical protein
VSASYSHKDSTKEIRGYFVRMFIEVDDGRLKSITVYQWSDNPVEEEKKRRENPNWNNKCHHILWEYISNQPIQVVYYRYHLWILKSGELCALPGVAEGLRVVKKIALHNCSRQEDQVVARILPDVRDEIGQFIEVAQLVSIDQYFFQLPSVPVNARLGWPTSPWSEGLRSCWTWTGSLNP